MMFYECTNTWNVKHKCFIVCRHYRWFNQMLLMSCYKLKLKSKFSYLCIQACFTLSNNVYTSDSGLVCIGPTLANNRATSIDSHQLVYLKASNLASSENHWFLKVHFNVHCLCISQSSFGQHLLCMFNKYITVCPGKIKSRKLCIWPIFTCINRTFDTGHPSRVNWLPLRVVHSHDSVYFR